MRAGARETRELAGTRANAALAAGTTFARRADSRVLAGAIALTALVAAGVALALTGQSGGSRTSPAAVHGAVRAEGLAFAGRWRLRGAASGSSRGGLAARRSARAKAAASGGPGRGSARAGTQASHEHVQTGSVLAATQLEARGHKLLGEGHYAAAIGDFRAALAASGQSSTRCGVPGSEACLTYAYALYDLGRALRLAGKPGSAVPVLTKRLRINNQRRTVKNELGLAKKAQGTGGVAAPSPKTPRPKKTPAPAAPAPTSTPTNTPTTWPTTGPTGSTGSTNNGATGA
jgi:tetratricopeptide (TPR) repeat protein